MLEPALQDVDSGGRSLLGRGPLCGAGGRDRLIWRTSLRRRNAALPNPNQDGTQNHRDASRRLSHTSRSSPSRAATITNEIIRGGLPPLRDGRQAAFPLYHW